MTEMHYYEAVGRRKRATARVRLYPAGETAEIIVNGKPMTEYFPRMQDQLRLAEPLKLAEMEGKFNVSVLAKGGGISGQADAVRLGIARALIVADPTLRPTLKKAGLLTRDARVKERKKPGLKRARKAPQYTKR
ncbi:MAG TPA: 30S ribosomal protein S9 [Caldilineales bacterium]|nr:30S ribosomal protein S9 [Caldilineales bacterium]